MVKLFIENGNVSVVPSENSQLVEIDSPYLTLTEEQIVERSKMQIGIHIMRNIMADAYVEEKDRTGIFKSIMTQLGTTNSGCYTYARNIRQYISGGDPYASNKKWNKKKADEVRAEKQNGREVQQPVEAAPETTAESNTDNRWCVENLTTNIVTSFTTRSAAQEYNKQLREQGVNSRWFDKQKSA